MALVMPIRNTPTYFGKPCQIQQITLFTRRGVSRALRGGAFPRLLQRL